MYSREQKLILIVDDSVDNLTLLEILFRSKDWDVHTASNGAQALIWLEHTSQLPDLVLLDLQMPVMNGAEFRIEQERHERLKDIPVVVMSASSDNREIQSLRPEAVLTKPLKLNTLVSSVSSFLQ